MASKVGESTVADLQQVIGDLSPTELEKFKVGGLGLGFRGLGV